MKDWMTVEYGLPEREHFVLTSIKHKNYFYHEVLRLTVGNIWRYHNGQILEEDRQVIGWMDLPAILTS